MSTSCFRETAVAGRESRLTVRTASEPREVRAALGLVYNSYVRCGLIEPNPFRMRVTPFHLLDTTEVFIGVIGGEVACTMTLVGDGEMGLPMESIYSEEVAWRRMNGAPVAEVSCLADRRQSLVRSMPVLIQVMSLMAQCARQRGVDELLIAVHPRHAPFYERFIGFEVVGQQKAYQQVCNKPAVALALDLTQLAAIHPRAYKRFFGSRFPGEELQYRPMSDELRAELREVVEATYDVPELCADAGSNLCEAERMCA